MIIIITNDAKLSQSPVIVVDGHVSEVNSGETPVHAKVNRHLWSLWWNWWYWWWCCWLVVTNIMTINDNKAPTRRRHLFVVIVVKLMVMVVKVMLLSCRWLFTTARHQYITRWIGICAMLWFWFWWRWLSWWIGNWHLFMIVIMVIMIKIVVMLKLMVMKVIMLVVTKTVTITSSKS